MIVRIGFTAFLAQLLCIGLIAANGNLTKTDNPAANETITPNVPPEPPVSTPTPPPPPATTNSTKPPTVPTTTTTTTTTSKPPTSPPSTTTTTTTPSTTTKPTTSKVPPTQPTPGPTPPPKSDRKFDAYSFLGGFALCLGLVAIGFLSWKFYISRQENYYHTL